MRICNDDNNKMTIWYASLALSATCIDTGDTVIADRSDSQQKRNLLVMFIVELQYKA